MSSADMDDLQCGLCLNTYKTPKFLPCFHTYCEDCLDNLVKTTPANPHKCPKCRTEFKIPAGGVRELQSNFYLTPLLSPERCTLHRTETLRFYCTDCKVPICLNCRMTDHFKHEAQDLGKVLDAARRELKNNQERLNECDESLTSQLNDLQRKSSHVTERTEILKVMIDERCKQLKRKFSTMVAESKRAVLEKLETTSGKLKRPFFEKEDCVNQRQITVRGQLREVTQALENNGCSLLNISVDLRDGQNIQQADDDSLPTSSRSVLYYKSLCSTGIKRDVIEPYLGQLKQIETIPLQEPISDPYVIDIGENQQLYVHAVLVDCDASGDTFVCVAYSWTPKDVKRSRVAWFRQDTKNLLHKFEEPIKGKVGLGGLNKGWVRVEGKKFPAKDMSLQKSSTAGNKGCKRRYDVYNKGHARFVLRVHHSGLCDLRSVTITGDTDTADFKVWEVSAKAPLAMDVSRNGQLMAVLEEGLDHVMLYRLGNKEPYATYRGNGEAFRPLDVCFCVIGGQERLVIADWLNDVLHVVEVGDSCTLIGHVGGELPQLAKPTALCVDKKEDCGWDVRAATSSG